jgi:hypothetical protein
VTSGRLPQARTHARQDRLTERERHSLRNEHGEASDKRENCKGKCKRTLE